MFTFTRLCRHNSTSGQMLYRQKYEVVVVGRCKDCNEKFPFALVFRSKTSTDFLNYINSNEMLNLRGNYGYVLREATRSNLQGRETVVIAISV